MPVEFHGALRSESTKKCEKILDSIGEKKTSLKVMVRSIGFVAVVGIN
jgi:hypothetical protein